MSKDSWNWDRDDLSELINHSESMRLEFKASKILEGQIDRVADELSREVSAFANSEGGTLVIGIAERRVGKTRVADHLDGGFCRDLWWPERLQSVVSANVSPPLPGIRVKGIPVSDNDKCLFFVIHVPQGTTAYQAHDRKYYGRQEYECVALPDHDIRLRMFRGRAASATVKVGNWRLEVLQPGTEKDPYGHGFKPPFLQEILTGAEPSQHPNLLCHHYNIVVENVGEINLTEFKVRLRMAPTGRSHFDDRSLDYKDGWPNPVGHFFYTKDSQSRPMKVNVYPKDQLVVYDDEIVLMEGEPFAEMGFVLNWTLYLRDSLPVSGQIDLAQAFEEGRNQP